jgi:hypothetical protein
MEVSQMPGWFVVLAAVACALAGAALIARVAVRRCSRSAVPAAIASPSRPFRLPTRSSAPAAAQPVDLDRSRLVGWRFGLLLGAGVEARLALRLAERLDLDIHEVMDLVADGCPAAVAARIAEPL